MNKRDQQREQRRQEILLCSLDMFIKRGFEATKIRDIAKELNISTGLFFHYYESKEKIYEELVKVAVQGSKAVKDISQKRNSIDFFKHLTESLFISIKNSPMTAKLFLFMKQTVNNDSIPQYIRDLAIQGDNIQISVPIILKGQEQGEIRDGNPKALALAFWGAVQGIAEAIASNPEMPCPEAEWVIDVLRRKN